MAKSTKKKTAAKKTSSTKSKTRAKTSSRKTGRPSPTTPKTSDKSLPDVKPQKDTADAAYHVAIGASAGGLDSLEKLFKNMPIDTGMIFTVITHLDPQQSSLLPSLLQRHTSMKVTQISEGIKAEPNEVYVIPAGKTLGLTGGIYRLLELEDNKIRMPVNHFFRDLAEDKGDKAIGIILSGTGTDGSVGLKDIKERMGLVLAEDPDYAQYGGMPKSAISTGLVDYILTPEEMPAQLVSYLEYGKKIPGGTFNISDAQEKALQKIFYLLRNKTGHDFSSYKRNSILRRIERRMNVHQIDSFGKYVRFLQENIQEIGALFKELLISVTSFFRDPEAYEVLKNKALPEILDDRENDREIRIWVPGVATGEEAYSIAIIFNEYIEKLELSFKLKIFGTDIDDDAIDIARRGIYPSSIVNDVSKERLKKYFVRSDDSYMINRQIRESVVFASQNLIKDPPFTHLDMVCCRNLLIYLDAGLQKKILPIFNYALKPNGILFLGSSESIGEYSDLFTVFDSKWKVFKRRPQTIRNNLYELDISRPLGPAMREKPDASPETRMTDMVKNSLLEEFAPPSVVVNDRGDIVYIQGHTGKFLEPAQGEPSNNIIEMAREGLKLQLPLLLKKAAGTLTEVRREKVRAKTNHHYSDVNIIVKPLLGSKASEGLFLVTFEEVLAQKNKRKNKKENSEKEVDDNKGLRQELADTKENLQTTIEELETSNEELKSMNEEYQSTNEELKSANEELETSREELQSLNEELSTVNSELKEKITRLSQTQDEMQSYLDSLDVPALFLDQDLRVKRFTRQMANHVNLQESDIGREISDITTNLMDKNLITDSKYVLHSLQAEEAEVQSTNGNWYLRRIMPFRTAEDKIDGVIIYLINIDDIINRAKEMAEEKKLRVFAEGIVNAVSYPMLILDKNLIIEWANGSFYSTFRVKSEQTEGQALYTIGSGQWNIPILKEKLEKILAQKEAFDNFEVEHDFPKIGHRKMLLEANKFHQEDEKLELIVLGIHDVTGKKS